MVFFCSLVWFVFLFPCMGCFCIPVYGLFLRSRVWVVFAFPYMVCFRVSLYGLFLCPFVIDERRYSISEDENEETDDDDDVVIGSSASLINYRPENIASQKSQTSRTSKDYSNFHSSLSPRDTRGKLVKGSQYDNTVGRNETKFADSRKHEIKEKERREIIIIIFLFIFFNLFTYLLTHLMLK